MSPPQGQPATRPPRKLELPPVTYDRSFWSALFTLAGRGRIAFEDGTWRLRAGTELVEVPAGDVTAVRVDRGLIWSSLLVETQQHALRFKGLPHTAAAHLRGAFLLLGLPERVIGALATWDGIVARQRYLNHRAWSAWAQQHAATRQRVGEAEVDWLPDWAASDVSRFTGLHDRLPHRVAELNRAHLERELVACARFFDSVEENPLTAKQREAMITDEDNTLVVAGAGTGKTSVVVGKVGYLVKRLGIPPREILLLAYNRAAANEMQERVDSRIGIDLKVSTFHALGLGIIGAAEGRKPSLSSLAERSDEPAAFIESVLQDMLADAVWRVPLLRHLVEYLRPCRIPEEFENKHGYISYLKSADIKTIRGEQVRSFEESVIADWLFLNGIEYAYEHPYEHDLASPTHRQYKPDFYLPQASVYIEHFGVSRDGSTAPWIDAGKYRVGMEWKRRIHVQYGTTLVETFSYDRQEGALTERLAERLATVGIEPRPRPPEEVRAALEGRKVFTVLAKLLATFLRHFKEGQHTLATLRTSSRGGDPHRRASFLGVFERVREAYEAALQEERAIDFQDMIGRAADHVAEGRFRSPYRYIIVDEFQDTSAGRARLVQGLVSQADDPRVTCVGDDWQSIYRFAGSDISYMTSFERHFGYAASVALDRTFRFGDRLLAASARFIQQNPGQLRKQLRARGDEGGPAVVVVEMGTGSRRDRAAAQRQAVDELREVLTRISQEHPEDQRAKVFLLGRYNFSAPIRDMDALCRGIPRVDAEFLTVHRSKGLQADYVVVLDVVSGRYGFPSEVDDDPLLGMVLSEPDAMEHAEERRLFYVALTRARRRVYILSRETQRSSFVDELMQPGYADLVEAPSRWAHPVPCPDCGGSLTKRSNSRTGRPFWGCINYPYCEGTSQACSVCQEGAMVLDGGVYLCSEEGCPAREEVCPKCGEGRLVRKTNRQRGTQFWGCSRWMRGGSGCTYTR